MGLSSKIVRFSGHRSSFDFSNIFISAIHLSVCQVIWSFPNLRPVSKCIFHLYLISEMIHVSNLSLLHFRAISNMQNYPRFKITSVSYDRELKLNLKTGTSDTNSYSVFLNLNNISWTARNSRDCREMTGILTAIFPPVRTFLSGHYFSANLRTTAV